MGLLQTEADIVSLIIFIVLFTFVIGLLGITIALFIKKKRDTEDKNLVDQIEDLKTTLESAGIKKKEIDPRVEKLTKREKEILIKIAIDNKISKEIASELHIEKGTVDKHIKNIYDKLEINTRSAATKFYLENFE